MSISDQQFISTAEFARFLGITPAAVLKRINSGRIRAVKMGRSYAISYSYLKEHHPDYKIPLVENGEYVSIMEAARILGLTRMAVYLRVKKGALKAKRVGRHFVIARNQIVPAEQEPVLSDLAEAQGYVSIPELAKILGCSRIHIFKQVQKGRIKAERVGRHYVIARSDIPSCSSREKNQKIVSEQYLSVVDVASVLGVSRIAVFNKIKKGQIKAIKIGRSYAIKRQELRPFYIDEPKVDSN